MLMTIPALQVSSASAGTVLCSYPQSLMCAKAQPGRTCADKGTCGLSYLASQDNTPALRDGFVSAIMNLGVHNYAIDNEPFTWKLTHADVVDTDLTNGFTLNPTPTALWDYEYVFSEAIRAVDSNATIFGPVLAIWNDIVNPNGGLIWNQALGIWNANDDLWISKFLGAACAANSPSHRNIVDVVDVHWYPEQRGLNLSGVPCRVTLGNNPACDDRSDGMVAARFESLRELWDWNHHVLMDHNGDGVLADHPEYNLALIPRLQQIIASKCPGLKLAITEWNTGHSDDDIGTALADVETLALFGELDLDYAFRWQMPARNSLAESAYRLFLKYDGSDVTSTVEGIALMTSSSDVNTVSGHAIISELKSRVYVILVNRTSSPQTVSVNLSYGVSYGVTPAKAYGFDAAGWLASPTQIPVSPGGFSGFTMPAHSARLVVGQLCAAGRTWCNGQCVNLQSDNFNCGSCGNQCSAAAKMTCSRGSCGCNTTSGCSGSRHCCEPGCGQCTICSYSTGLCP
jgi:hypothetical protein